MARAIAYDITRLFIGPLFRTPRGIDRVDLALARRVFGEGGDANLGILPTPWGIRAFPAALVRRLLARLEALWAERAPAGGDAKLAALVAGLAGAGGPGRAFREAEALSLPGKAGRILRLLGDTGVVPGRAAHRAVPTGAAYVNVGQLGLAVPAFFGWLARRPDVTCAIMLHDVIPLEYPHLVGRAAVGHHARMVRTAADRADCLVFNTACARDGVMAAMRPHRDDDMPSLVRALPLPAAFAEVRESPAALAGAHYHVIVSTIEPRKNHALLLAAWRGLAASMGDAAPHLVIVGSPGRGAQAILDALDKDPALRARVHVVSGLSSPALAALVLGAGAMLCPSFAEGFGLPLLEAVALGVPCIASDIPAHREIGAGRGVTLLPCDDVSAWQRAIAGVPVAPLRSRPAIPHDLTEEAYCADLLEFVAGVAKDRG